MSRITMSAMLALALAGGCKVSTSGLLSKASGGSGGNGSTASSGGEGGGGGGGGGGSDGDCWRQISLSDDERAEGIPEPPCAKEGDYNVHQTWEAQKRYFRPKVAVAPGVPTVGKFKAPWCKGPKTDVSYTAAAVVRLIKGVTEPGGTRDPDPLDIFGTSATGAPSMCLDPDDARFQDLMGAYVQVHVNATGASAEDVGAYLAVMADEERSKQLNAETCAKVQPDDEASGRERALGRMTSAVLGCSHYKGQTETPLFIDNRERLGNEDYPLWHLDRAAAPPSQIAALYRVLRCTANGSPDDLYAVVDYAACRADARALDRKKLDAELKAGGYNEHARSIAVLSLARAKLRAGAFETALQKLAAKDEEYKEVLLDAPARAWKQWTSAADEAKDALAAAHAYEDRFNGPRRSAAKGCLADAHKALRAYVARHGGNSRAEVLGAATDAIGGVLLEQVRSCNELEGQDAVVAELEQVVRWGKPRRGPRYAVHVAMIEAVARIASDRPKFPITGEMVGFDSNGPVPSGLGHQSEWNHDHAGTVARVEKKGDLVYITFKTERWKEDEYECKDGHRIVMFDAHGTPIYERSCRKTGRKVERSSTAEPFFTTADNAFGIAAGTFVKYRTGAERDGDEFWKGVAGEVWSSKEQTKLIAVAGLPAK